MQDLEGERNARERPQPGIEPVAEIRKEIAEIQRAEIVVERSVIALPGLAKRCRARPGGQLAKGGGVFGGKEAGFWRGGHGEEVFQYPRERSTVCSNATPCSWATICRTTSAMPVTGSVSLALCGVM